MPTPLTSLNPTPTGAPHWAVWVVDSACASLAAFRTSTALSACAAEQGVWVRLSHSNVAKADELLQTLHVATGAEVFQVTDDGQVIPVGRRVPTGILPTGPWKPLRELLPVILPRAGFAAQRPPKAQLRLIRTDKAQEPAALVLELSTWVKFVTVTPAIRLSRWEFAVSAQEQVLVRGAPLPAVPGAFYYDCDGILLPVGFRWEPAIPARSVQRMMGLAEGDLAIWQGSNCAWQRLPGDKFVPALRANVRQTAFELFGSGGAAG